MPHETRQAWLKKALISDGTLECPTDQGSIKVPYPVPFSELPSGFELDLKEVEAVNCGEIQ